MEAAGPPEMYVHFQQVGEIHDAIVLGDVEATRAPARALANSHNPYGEAAVEAWQLMQAEARGIQEQHDLLDLSRSVARMGMACGACHLTMEDGPDIQPGDPPSGSRVPTPHMLRHQWATDRLWEGLVGPSPTAWAAGAGALRDAALDFGPPGNRAAEVEQLARRVHLLGDDCRHTESWEDRASIYGRLLETCANCHELMGLRMR